MRGDGLVIAADPTFAGLIGAPDAAALVGRYWPSLVTPRTAHRLQEAERATATGQRWAGALELLFADRPVELHFEVLVASTQDDLVLLRATEMEPPPGETAGATPPETEDAAVLRALVAAMEAVEQMPHAASAARSVLQALHPQLAFDWAAVLLLAADGGEVLCTYPSAMGGIEAGARWTALDSAERYTLVSGEPSLSGELAVSTEDASPLARLAGFGMRSALRVPLYGGGRVVGGVSLYSHEPHAFSPADGVRLDRFVRPLGQRLRRAEPPVEAAPPAAFEPPPEPPVEPPPEAEPPVEAAPPAGFEPPVEPPVEPSPEATPPTAPAAIESPAESPVETAHGVEPLEAQSSAAQSERLAALGELVSGVAHELNNPLTSILGYAQMVTSLEGAERDQALNTIEQEALRASRIVRNLLAFARQHRPRVESVDINAVLRRVAEVRRYSLAMDDVTIEMELGDLPDLLGDEYQLEQVFLQLVNNAHQAMPEGGAITIGSELAGDRARVTVSDTGPGIPDEVAQRVFDPFFTTREVGRGSGMGLSIVYGTVTEHGGRVWIEQAPAGGARFVVELPLAPAAAEQPAPPAAEQGAPRPGRGEHILVVDDEMPIRMLAREILNASGYEAEMAASGDEALRKMEEDAYDLVLADVRMLGMDGVELYRRIGERWPQLQRRLIVITGDAGSERTAALLREEDVPYLEKPFDTTQLLRAVRELLDRG